MTTTPGWRMAHHRAIHNVKDALVQHHPPSRVRHRCIYSLEQLRDVAVHTWHRRS